MDHDVDELIGKVAERHGIRLDRDDPAFALVTLNELTLDSCASQLRHDIQSTIDSFSDSVQRLEARTGAIMAHEIRQAAAEIRRHLSADLSAAGVKTTELVTRIHSAHERPNVLRWTTVGLISAGFLLICGFLIGRLSVGYL